MKKLNLFSLVVAAGLFATSLALAAGEWDTAKAKAAIEKHVAAKPLEVQDPKTNQKVKLTLRNVSNEVVPAGQNAIVKADCVDAAGKSYDVDFTVDKNYRVISHKLRQGMATSTE